MSTLPGEGQLRLCTRYDTTVPVLAKGKTDTGRCWVYVRDDRPFGGLAPPAAMFYYSRDLQNSTSYVKSYRNIYNFRRCFHRLISV